jgi:RNA polymerase sigma-70 factor (ECF subfamily)
MTDASLSNVRRLLVDRYDELRRRLTARLGSPDLAADALQDAWLRIERAETVGTIRNPASYIFGVAMNAARDRMREANSRHLSAAEVDGLLDIPDEAATPSKIVEIRSDLRQLEVILCELPQRQREILLAARLDQMPRAEIARQFDISVSLVEKELQRALEYCLARRNKNVR